MSRHGYSDGCDGWDLICWRGAVESALRGKRGQAFLKELLNALDALPEKRLIDGDLQNTQGEVCALGSVGLARGINMEDLDVYNSEYLSKVFGIANAMVREIEYINDSACYYRHDTPEQRWKRVREWVLENIKKEI